MNRANLATVPQKGKGPSIRVPDRIVQPVVDGVTVVSVPDQIGG